MSFEFIRKLPSPTEIKAEFPVPEKTDVVKSLKSDYYLYYLSADF